ncbi:hypothetical protein GIX45_22325 [Erwinia sp. CPCC 100877]|nr:hypothetical protein [Erwinia sp. CPCC 100877]
MKDVITARPVVLDGVCNVRDLGGYRVHAGMLRPGRLFRGADLSALTPHGQQRLTQMSVSRIIDLRTDGEVAEAPDRYPESARLVRLDVLKAVMKGHSADPKEMVARLDQCDPTRILLEIYRAFVTDAACLEAWRGFFNTLLEADDGAIYFHCTAGKDRTGFAAALVLLALGAKTEAIVADYLLSNRYREEENQRLLAKFMAFAPDKRPEDILALLQVQEAWLQNALTAMDEGYGSADAFLRDALGIGIQERRRLNELLVVAG